MLICYFVDFTNEFDEHAHATMHCWWYINKRVNEHFAVLMIYQQKNKATLHCWRSISTRKQANYMLVTRLLLYHQQCNDALFFLLIDHQRCKVLIDFFVDISSNMQSGICILHPHNLWNQQTIKWARCTVIKICCEHNKNKLPIR